MDRPFLSDLPVTFSLNELHAPRQNGGRHGEGVIAACVERDPCAEGKRGWHSRGRGRGRGRGRSRGCGSGAFSPAGAASRGSRTDSDPPPTPSTGSCGSRTWGSPPRGSALPPDITLLKGQRWDLWESPAGASLPLRSRCPPKPVVHPARQGGELAPCLASLPGAAMEEQRPALGSPEHSPTRP